MSDNLETKSEATEIEAPESDESLTTEELVDVTGGASSFVNVAGAQRATLVNRTKLEPLGPGPLGPPIGGIDVKDINLKNFDPRAFLDGGTCGALC